MTYGITGLERFKYVTFHSVGQQTYNHYCYINYTYMIRKHYCTRLALNHTWVWFYPLLMTQTFIYIYIKLNDIIGYQQFSDAVWKQVFYLNLNYCKQSNSTIVTVHKMLSITQKHMQCSPDGQLQIINYIPLLVAEICFLLLHYLSWGNKF